MQADSLNKTVNPNEAESGIGLLELMIAIVVLSFGILAMMTMQVNAIHVNSSARRITQSATLGSDRVEKLMALPYADALLAPGSVNNRVDGRYTIQWQVSADDAPVQNVKTVTINVSCMEGGQQRNTQYVYYKAR